MLRNRETNKIRVYNHKEKRWYSATELFEMGTEELPKLWEPYLPQTGLAMLSGASDCGKSTFLRQLSLSIVQQEETFLEHRLILKQGVVFYVSTEDGIDALAASIRRQVSPEERRNSHDNLKFLIDSEGIERTLDKALSNQPADLVVIDTWSDIFLDNPNNFVEVRRNLNLYKKIVDKHHCLIVFLHHNVKNSEKHNPDKNKVNGSQAIEAKMRTVLELRQGEQVNERLLTVVKSNYMSGAMKKQSLVLEFDEERLMMRNTNRTVSHTGIAGEGTKRYDPTVWLPRFQELRNDDLSIEACQKKLVSLHPNEDVPGVTWFKTNGKGPTDGQSTPLEFDGPTDKPKLPLVSGQSVPIDSDRPTDKPKSFLSEFYNAVRKSNPNGNA